MISGSERDVAAGKKAAVVPLVVVCNLAVGAAVVVVFTGAQAGEPRRLMGWISGGLTWRDLGTSPGRLRKLEVGQLCSAHSDLDRGLDERSQVVLGDRAHVTVRERTPPPHVTGHCQKKSIYIQTKKCSKDQIKYVTEGKQKIKLTSSQVLTAQSCPQGTSLLHGTTGLGLRRCLHSTGGSTLSSPETVRTQSTVLFLTPSEPQVAVHCCQPPTHHLKQVRRQKNRQKIKRSTREVNNN